MSLDLGRVSFVACKANGIINNKRGRIKYFKKLPCEGVFNILSQIIISMVLLPATEKLPFLEVVMVSFIR